MNCSGVVITHKELFLIDDKFKDLNGKVIGISHANKCYSSNCQKSSNQCKNCINFKKRLDKRIKDYNSLNEEKLIKRGIKIYDSYLINSKLIGIFNSKLGEMNQTINDLDSLLDTKNIPS